MIYREMAGTSRHTVTVERPSMGVRRFTVEEGK